MEKTLMSSSSMTAFDLMEVYKPKSKILFEDLKDLPFVEIDMFGTHKIDRTGNHHTLQVDIQKVLEQMTLTEHIDTRTHHQFECQLNDEGYLDYVCITRGNNKPVLEWILYEVLLISKEL